MFKKGGATESTRKEPVFIDLADFPVTDASGDKRIKVVRPKEAADLRSLKSYILSRISVIIDLTDYSGDPSIARSLVSDSVSECGGSVWTVSPTALLATPYDVTVDNGE